MLLSGRVLGEAVAREGGPVVRKLAKGNSNPLPLGAGHIEVSFVRVKLRVNCVSRKACLESSVAGGVGTGFDNKVRIRGSIVKVCKPE